MLRRAFIASLMLFACSATADRPRCAQCGMFADTMPRWQAGVTASDARALVFDGPKCMLRWLLGHASGARDDAWVTEYYTQARRPARDSVYVLGSDVRGPMGDELVPLSDRDAAARFSREHHGRRTMTWQELRATPDIGALFR